MAHRTQFVEENDRLMSLAKDTSEADLLFTYNGVSYPSLLSSPDTLQAMGAVQLRGDDVLMACYPKCGTNWTLQILHDIVYTISNKEPPPIMAMLEFGTPEKFEALKKILSPRVLGTHLHSDNLPKSTLENKVKTLVVFRNPKDAAVSYFNFYNSIPLLPNYKTWNEFFMDFMSGKVCWGSYFDHALVWNKRIDEENVLMIMFEDMKADLVGAVKQIADFFGIHLTEEQIQFVADKGSFNTMKEKSEDTHGSIGSSLFRKGDIGDWKNYFSEAQSQEMDAKFEECLAGTELGKRMKYDVYCKI